MKKADNDSLIKLYNIINLLIHTHNFHCKCVCLDILIMLIENTQENMGEGGRVRGRVK